MLIRAPLVVASPTVWIVVPLLNVARTLEPEQRERHPGAMCQRWVQTWPFAPPATRSSTIMTSGLRSTTIERVFV